MAIIRGLAGLADILEAAKKPDSEFRESKHSEAVAPRPAKPKKEPKPFGKGRWAKMSAPKSSKAKTNKPPVDNGAAVPGTRDSRVAIGKIVPQGLLGILSAPKPEKRSTGISDEPSEQWKRRHRGKIGI